MLADYGGFTAPAPGDALLVGDVAGLQRAVRACSEQRRGMRVRCFAHSMNGMSLPKRDELLIDLTAVRHVRRRGEDLVEVGAGLSVWELDRYVRAFGWKVPVINDGGAAAPSVGGFIAAGGIGEGTLFYGGFWESVSSATLVTAHGDVRRVNAGDALFPWLFGSIGTLAVVYEAVIRLVPAGSAPVERVPDVAALPAAASGHWPPHLWLTLFVSEDRRVEALTCLTDLEREHSGAWSSRGLYEYYVQRRRFNPPLLFDGGSDFIALGIWGDRALGKPELGSYFALEDAFQRLVETRGFRRYFQSELIGKQRDLADYVGSACASRYRAVKAELDPGGLLNAVE